MNNVMMAFSRYRPSILLGLGIGSMIAAICTGVKYAPLAKDAIDERKEELGTDDLPLVETIKSAGVYMIPTAAFAIVGIGCILGSNHENLERQVAAMTACSISETTNQIYREKAKEILGEKKEKTIHEAAAKEAYKRDREAGEVLVVSSGSQGWKMYDSLTKQEFRGNIEKVKATINNLNRNMLSQDITIDDYCLYMGEQPMEMGTNLGWNIDHGFIEIEPPTAIVNEEGEPVIIITHKNRPRTFC